MNTNMLGDKFMSRMFRKVDTAVWDLMTGKLGVRTPEGEIATIEGEGDTATISLNPFDDFGIAVPAFAQSTPMASVKAGDLIYTSGSKPKWVVEAIDKPDGTKRFKTIDPGGSIGNWNPPKVQMFGLDSGVLVVRSLLSMFATGDGKTATAGLEGLQGMLLPMMMMGGDNLDLDKMMPLMLMSSMGGMGAAGSANMMQMMLMMQMFSGNNSPFGSGGSRKPTPFRG